MKALTKADILAAQDIKTKAIEVPEWGGVVYLREMSVKERSKFFSMMKDGDVDSALTVTMAICDEAGAPLFNAADAEKLCAKNGAVIDRLLKAWLDMNGLTKESAEEAEKN